ncbi:hypothetical protein M8C21_018611 [Ambrosia artemisiifolia]|uniref:U3 small nucleolar RNA-associated protein 25 n=1 Tax=Ambrosia artemisiifolia TaxID=4212 RepID=A0AAD5GTD9_AMBAR|nr:hypothetical protein M8C21_018611 [Ambrosia artemisiifolia]
MYDTLLKTLGSTSKSIANAYKRRQRAEEGKSDSDEDEDMFENKSKQDALYANDVQGASLAAMEERIHGNSIEKESESSSSFATHLDYKLSKEEVKLPTKKGIYKSRFKAANCKWQATKELNLEDSYSKPPYGLNMKLYDHWLNTYKASGGQDLHSSRQRAFFSLCNSYQDILHHNKKPFYRKGREEDSNFMDGYLLHSLNHIFKTRDLVTKNDKMLSKGEELLNSEKFLDQGFTRPKVLIILPIRSIAYRVINRLIQLTPEGHKVNVDHAGRFIDNFLNGGPVRSKSWKKSKPLDHQALFRGNDDDDFIIGIKFTKKTIKLYSDFYTSDMIVASPLNLIHKIEEAEVEKEKDVDYLSSIEVLIIDHADVLAMQVKSRHKHKGVLPKVLLQVTQSYERIDTESNEDAFDARFDYFKTKVFPKIKDSVQGGIMLYISSYFEFVRVRNFLKSQDASMCLVGEYTKEEDKSCSRTCFFHGGKKIVLYTERAQFYYRYKIRGIQNLIIYSLPERKEFYHEIVNMLDESQSVNCTVLFTRFDILRLERIVGAAAAKQMVASDKSTFIFV